MTVHIMSEDISLFDSVNHAAWQTFPMWIADSVLVHHTTSAFCGLKSTALAHKLIYSRVQ